MSENHPSDLDSVQLTDEERAQSFTRYWTGDRIEEAKLLAKKLLATDLDAVEEDGLRAEPRPEGVVVVMPARDDDDDGVIGGLSARKDRPKLHIEMEPLAGEKGRVFRLYDTSNFPEDE